MDKKEQDKEKSINLMPEDLRSKESGILSKVKNKSDFDFDFVSPKSSDIQKTSDKSTDSFFAKLKNIFNRPARFGQSKHSDKDHKQQADKKEKITNNTTENKQTKTSSVMDLHMPDNSIKKHSDLHINYKNNDLAGDNKNTAKIINKLSFWQQLKQIFVKKPKKSQEPNLEKALDKDVIPKKAELDNSKDTKDKPANGPIDILEEKNISHIPELDTTHKDKPANSPDETIKPLSNKVTDSKASDFYIPTSEEDDKAILSAKKPEVKDKKPDIGNSKFHQPQPRIRARLLEDGGGVDLIPVSAKTRSWKQVAKLLIITSLIFALVVAGFYGFLFYQEKSIEDQRVRKDEQITSLERQIIEYEELNNKISELGLEIKTIHSLLGFHVYWTNFFQLLEKYTISDVYYEGINAGNGGAMTLEAVATDFEALSRQIKVLEQTEAQEFVTSVDVLSAEYSDIKGVSFGMTIVLNPSLFAYNKYYIHQIEN